MHTRTLLFLIALAIFLAALFLLVSGSGLLMLPLGMGNGSNVPLGTPITWLGIIALPTAIYMGLGALHPPENKAMRRYRRVIQMLILLAVSWGFVCYLLAGNWSFSFSGSAPSFRGSAEASPYFWYFTALVVLFPLVFLLVYGVHRLILKRAKRKNGL